MVCRIDQRGKGKRVVITFLTILIIVSFTIFPVWGEDLLFTNLERRLIDDGVDAELVRKIYQHPAVKLEPSVLAVNLKRSEKALYYDQYLTDAAVAKANDYLRDHRPTLEAAYQQFGVPPSIIVAILMVETRLGAYGGKHLTINVLSTMAVADDPLVQKQVFSSMAPEDDDPATQSYVLAQLRKRVDRGYRELKALLDYIRKSGRDPFDLKGSSEGAIGIPQFLPSNIRHYGQDGNGDGIVDLFLHEDAIASVATFLKAHKWNRDQNVAEQKRVLLHYNKSTYYVDAIISLAKHLEDGPR